MNHYQLKDNKGNSVPIKVPTKWSDVSFGTYKKIIGSKDKTDRFFISTLLDFEDIDNLIIADNYSMIIKDIEFLKNKLDYTSFVPPTHVSIDGKQYRIALDIGKETLGQYEDCKGLLKKEDDTYNIAMACAIYIQPEIDGYYNINKAKELLTKIDQLPCDFVLSVGNFFLSKLLGLKNGLMKTYQRASTSPKRLRRVILNLQKCLGL